MKPKSGIGRDAALRRPPGHRSAMSLPYNQSQRSGSKSNPLQPTPSLSNPLKDPPPPRGVFLGGKWRMEDGRDGSQGHAWRLSPHQIGGGFASLCQATPTYASLRQPFLKKNILWPLKHKSSKPAATRPPLRMIAFNQTGIKPIRPKSNRIKPKKNKLKGHLTIDLDYANKAALKRAHSRRFAMPYDSQYARQRLECGVFSTALFLVALWLGVSVAKN